MASRSARVSPPPPRRAPTAPPPPPAAMRPPPAAPAAAAPPWVGAEAHVAPLRFLGRAAVRKRRARKRYRLPQLDARLAARRLQREARALLRLRAAGVRVPALYSVDARAGALVMERVRGATLRALLRAERDAAAQPDAQAHGQRDAQGAAKRDGQADGQADGQGDGQADAKRDGQGDGQGDGRGDGRGDGQGGAKRDAKRDGQGDGQGDAKRHGQGDAKRDAQGDGQGDGHGERAERAMQHAGRAVARMHGCGVVHGDLTTGNIIVQRGGQVCLIDFGLSSANGSEEDRAVDLYVLERAVISAHSEKAQPLNQAFLHAYAQEAKRPAVLQRLEQVRARGRKRDMSG